MAMRTPPHWSAWALPFCFGSMSLPYPCPPGVAKKQSLKSSAGRQADVRSRHWALGLLLLTSEFLGRMLPTLSEPFYFFFFSCGIETKMHTKADHLAHKSSFEMGWANAPCRYRHIICKNLFCPLPSFTVALKIILFQRKSQLVCQFVLYSYV